MRALAILFFAALLIAVIWRATGHALPLIDYNIGGFGGWFGPEIRITPPGYNVPLP